MEANNMADNIAAIRDALKSFVDAYETTSYTLCLVNLHPPFQKAKAALAKPPRNCDRFGGDNALLQKAYLSECGGNYNPLDANSRQAYLVGYGNWLLAPAKKGTAK